MNTEINNYRVPAVGMQSIQQDLKSHPTAAVVIGRTSNGEAIIKTSAANAEMWKQQGVAINTFNFNNTKQNGETI